MARGRMINRKVSVSGKVAALGDDLGPWAVVFQHRLIAFLDKNGNVRADPYWLKAEVMPRVAGINPDDCRKFAGGLVEHGLAVMYELDGMEYLHFPGFRDEQIGLRPDREPTEVPVPQGFDEKAGRLPDNCRKTSGNNPENIRSRAAARGREVEVEVEVEEKKTTGGARAHEGLGPNGAEFRDSPSVSVTPFPAAVEELPFGSFDWRGRTSASVVLREWIDRQPTRPSKRDRQRFEQACRRIADAQSVGTIALAFLGIECIWPHAPPPVGNGEPWTPEDLEKRFAKAVPAAKRHPALKARVDEAEFERALEQGAWG